MSKPQKGMFCTASFEPVGSRRTHSNEPPTPCSCTSTAGSLTRLLNFVSILVSFFFSTTPRGGEPAVGWERGDWVVARDGGTGGYQSSRGPTLRHQIQQRGRVRMKPGAGSSRVARGILQVRRCLFFNLILFESASCLFLFRRDDDALFLLAFIRKASFLFLCCLNSLV